MCVCAETHVHNINGDMMEGHLRFFFTHGSKVNNAAFETNDEYILLRLLSLSFFQFFNKYYLMFMPQVTLGGNKE